jgi:glutamate/tyrosine decarboxylase-like PLP-dependent enzyme
MAAMSMHEPTPQDVAAAQRVLAWSMARLADRRAVLPPVAPLAVLPEPSEQGIGVEAAIELLLGVITPTAIPVDHPRYLAFVPGAPTVAAAIADMALSAAMVYGGSRLEAGLAAEAEDAVVRWLADIAGFPAGAGGTFVSGGSIANLSALVAARGDRYAATRRQVIVAGASAHSSLAAAARIMGCDFIAAPPADDYGRLTGPTLAAALDGRDADDIVAVVATAGATNNGAVDDLAGVAAVCGDRGIWLHVDGAYGGAALLSSHARHLFAGVERADSFIVDPHKWLYTPFDCAAVLYRDAAAARRALTQQADYLEWVRDEGGGDPSDLAIHLTRRVRGMPLWVSLQAYGRRAYGDAVDECFVIAQYAAEQVARRPYLELVLDPALTVLLVRRCGWGEAEYDAWSTQALQRGLAFVIPTKHRDETVLRLCFVNPLTTRADVDLVLDDMG